MRRVDVISLRSVACRPAGTAYARRYSKLTSNSKMGRIAPMTAGLMHHGLEQAAARFGSRDALWAGDERWSFEDLDGLSNAFARHLLSQGVGSGDRVAVMLTNRPEFIVAVNAVSKLGAAAVLLSPAWKALEVGHAVELTGPVLAITDGEAAGVLGARLGADRVIDL